MSLPLLYLGPADLVASSVAALFGLMIGSFLNVVIHRLPRMMQRESENYVAQESGAPLPHADRYNLWTPRSCCPHCAHRISALQNIPVLSYLVQGGKCTQCGQRISARYPVVEILTGILSALLVWRFGTNLAGLSALLFTYFLIAMSFIDADTQLLPDDLSFPLLWTGLLVNLSGTFVSLGDAVIGAVVGYLALWSVYWAFKLITGKEGMGYGDFKLLAALGAWLGWQMLPLIVLLSSLVGAVTGVALIVLVKRGRDKPIPFGPYLAAAGFIALLYGETILRTYLARTV
jgi:leader peptidase (prepilin peptidase) / N-methyltransferase